MLELDEAPADGVAREVLEETGVRVRAEELTGVYKNMKLGVVTLAFRCSIVDGQAQESDEARRVAWLTVEEATRRMPEARAVRVTDALSGASPAVRIHDGTHLLLRATMRRQQLYSKGLGVVRQARLARAVRARSYQKHGESVDFTLTYDGPLASNARPIQKHEIRLALHPQLKELWSHPPLEKLYWKASPGSSHVRTLNDYDFCSIVHPEWHFNASLDILMLRPETPGRIITSRGDIDNRLKTLFDALSCPVHEQDIPRTWTPTDDQKRLHCLLEDDGLISQVTVQTDRLLAASTESHVKLIIKVNVHTTQAFGGLAVLA